MTNQFADKKWILTHRNGADWNPQVGWEPSGVPVWDTRADAEPMLRDTLAEAEQRLYDITGDDDPDVRIEEVFVAPPELTEMEKQLWGACTFIAYNVSKNVEGFEEYFDIGGRLQEKNLRFMNYQLVERRNNND